MIRPITIKTALNGYIATVGCQTLVFNHRKEMLKELDSYLDKPQATEKRYRTNAVNRELLNRDAIAEPREPATTYTATYTTAAPLTFTTTNTAQEAPQPLTR